MFNPVKACRGAAIKERLAINFFQYCAAPRKLLTSVADLGLGQFGVSKTVAQLQRYCYWPKMHETVSRYVRGCTMCAKSKPSNRKLGLYTPLPVPSHPSKSVSMDFVGGLPKSRKGHDYLYVIVDRFSKMCILIPCNKQITAEQTVKLFFQHVWCIFGYPLP